MPGVDSKDFYKILGVSEDATQEEIRKAYRKLAHQYHPDKTGGDPAAETKLKEINEAYDVLKNKEKRAEYDDTRKWGAGVGGWQRTNFDPRDFGDMFGHGFGFGDFGGGPRRQRGADLEANVRVSLSEIAEGTKKRIRIRRREQCAECGGTGGAVGTSPVTCDRCGGKGHTVEGNGFFSVSRVCPVCNGTGQRYTTPCSKCAGSGGIAAARELDVKIPAGFQDGGVLRLRGEGEAGDAGAPSGDLLIRVHAEPDPVFKREGKNLICEVPVTFAQAALGDTVRVPTIKGVADLTLKPGSQSGEKLRMRGMGLPSASGNGDQIVELVVEVPRRLSAEQKRVLREYAGMDEAEGAHPLIKAFKSLLERFRS